MSLYLAVFKKRDAAPFPDAAEFEPYLPYPESGFEQRVNRRTALYVWSWSATSRPVRDTPRGALLVQGFCSGATEDYLAERLSGSAPLDHGRVENANSAVMATDDALHAYVSLPGCELAYYLDTPDFLAVSNRLGPLSHFARLGFRPDAVMEMAGRTHITDNGTLFNEVRKLMNGERLRCDERGPRVEEMDYAGLWEAEEYSLDEALARLADFAAAAGAYGSGGFPLRLELSGGMDSRALLGMLDAAGIVDANCVCVTNGEYFSPEVMAARDVMALYGDSGPEHVIRRPTEARSGAAPLASLAGSLYASEGLIGLADLCGVPRSGRLTLGGHDFHKFPANARDLPEYVRAKEGQLNGSGFIRERDAARYRERYGECFARIARGAPRERYPMLEILFVRYPGWRATTVMTRTLADMVAHPFAATSYMRLVLNAPLELTQTQLVVFELMRRSGKPLAYQPFCHNAWPPALYPLLDRLRIPYDPALRGVQPYEFSPLLPDAKFFGYSHSRKIAVEIARAFLPAFTGDNPGYFAFLNRPALLDALAVPYDRMAYGDMNRILALLNIALCMRYRDDFLKRSGADRIARDLARLDGVLERVDRLGALSERLADYSRSIARLVRRNRRLLAENGEYARRGLAESGISLGRTPCSFEVRMGGERELEVAGAVFFSPEDSGRSVILYLTLDGRHQALPGLTWSDWLKVFYVYPVPAGQGPHFALSFAIPEGVSAVGLHFMHTGKGDCALAGPPTVAGGELCPGDGD